MVKKTVTDQEHVHENPLFHIGLLKNRKTYIDELNELLDRSEQKLKGSDISRIVNEKGFCNRNVHGYAQESDGTPITDTRAKYKLMKTGLKDDTGQEIVGWFSKSKNGKFEGIKWGTEQIFISSVIDEKKFRIGDFFFDDWNCGFSFLEDLAKSTIPETWDYQHKQSHIPHPILKSYIENIFNRLKQEKANGEDKKIIKSQDGKWIMFNTNLLDKFFHEILIAAEVRNSGGKIVYFNPQRIKSLTERLNKKFTREDKPQAPKFFENINDVVFQTKWEIDRSYDKFTHILEDRCYRYPNSEDSIEERARKLDEAIDCAVAIAQRNYKFVVPMYRPQRDSIDSDNFIQLLMPIYLKGTFSEHPDFALVLSRDSDNGLYTPETILPLDAAYQNARLIAKPDETWLNPNNI